MNDAYNPRLLKIQSILTQFLSEKIVVSEDTLFFARSTYGINDREFAAAVNDGFFEERELLISMLLFPTQQLRELLEPILVSPLVEIDVQILVESIAHEISQVGARLPDGSDFSFDTSGDAITHFVEKLYMTREPDKTITESLRKHATAEITARLSVYLRCRNLSFTREAQLLLLKFIEEAAHREKDFEGLAELLLTATSQVPAGMSVTDHLFEQLEYQKKLLFEIDEFQQKSEQYGMEYLMMQNYPVPHESKENVSERLHKFTIIIEEILSLQNRKENYLNRRDLGTFDTEKDLEKLFRSLS